MYWGGLCIITFLIVFYPALHKLVTIWANSEEYSHAFLVIPVVGYMIWQKRILLNNLSQKYASLGVILITLSLVLYYFALLTEVNSIIFFSMFLTLVGIIIYLLGFRALVVLTTPLLLLLILIPIPEQFYTSLTFPLQLKVSEVSEIILRTAHIPMLREGNIMQIPGMSFEVIEACSGLRSVVALVTLSILMGSFAVKTFKSKFILFSISIPLAIFVNVIRVVSMILLYHYFGMDLTEGPWHTTMGLLVFFIAIAILFILQNVLEFWEQKKIKNF
jgi:exosortase